MLQLTKIDHPHTADKMATALNDCLTEWEPGSDKVMMIVSDNGSNMVKAIQLLKDMNTDDDCLSESDGEMTEDDDYENETAVPELPEEVRYRRMPRMAHTIQLLIKKVYVNYYGHVLEKTRFLVSKLRKSSEAVQKLVAKCGKTVVSDNSTRWNSTD